MTAELKKIRLDKVVSHPDNPRVALREDVVSALMANMNGEYPKKHAIHVRKVEETFQILSGHQRTEAARRKAFDSIWAWVDDLDDEAAFMELVTSNNQGELSPLEIGIHAFKAVSLGEKGRGKKGGLREYADRIGKDESYIRQLRNAAEVIAENADLSTHFLDKAKHLAALHKLPRSCWQGACEWLAETNISAADVESRVQQALEFRKDFYG